VKTTTQKWLRLFSILWIVIGMIGLYSAPATQTVSAQAATPPLTVLINTVVDDWTIADPRLVWLTYPTCPSPPPGNPANATTEGGGTLQAAGDPVTISRVRTTGSEARTIYSRNDPRQPGVCNPYKLNSNIVADANYVYWVDATQLVRLPHSANPGDAPQAWGPTFFNDPENRVQLFLRGDRIVALQQQDCNFCLQGTSLKLVNTTDGTWINNFALFEYGNSPAFDGKYIYFKDAEGALRRITPDSNDPIVTIAAKVGDYVVEGDKIECFNINCVTTSYVFYVQPDGNNSIVRYNNIDGNTLTLYTPAPTGGQVTRLYGLSLARRFFLPSIGQSLFFFEQRYTPCPVPPGCFVTAATELLRTTGRSGGTPEDLYYRDSDTANRIDDMLTDGTNLYWREKATYSSPGSNIKRLPANAESLPKINLLATGIEITQGIQRSDNSVPLIQLRPTFVRFYVRSAGQEVPGVTARLEASASGLGTISLSPINANLRSRITVVPNPQKNQIDQSFLFQLPWDYTRASDLRLRAVVNPFGVPLEPTLADNAVSAGPFEFKPTPTLTVFFMEFNYRLNNTNYKPQGTLSNVSWISRVYPLGARIDNSGEWAYGLNYRIFEINDAGLAVRVNRQLPECEGFVVRNSAGVITTDNRELCASAYVNGVLRDWRARRNLLATTFLYGEIPDSGVGNQFPRGQEGGSSVSSGPDGTAWNGFYAGHEVGHSLGLGHPMRANGECGISGGDPKPDYPSGKIGPADGSVYGFDSRTNSLLAPTGYYDVMAYCQPQWISDVNYERIYTKLTTPALQAAPQQAEQGDWLSVYGMIAPDGNSAAISYLRRLSGEAAIPLRVEGAYTLRLLDSGGATLADYPFSAEESADAEEWQNFGQIVPFVAGTRQIQIVANADNKVLASQSVSASAPTISDVALQSPSEPISGTVTLSWTASDADGDPLQFDLLYSRDGGASFELVQLGVTGTSSSIDTNSLGGGSGIFRVVASDGVQSAEADSPTYTLASKAPEVRITSPTDGTQVEWGQLVNFLGEAQDLQDGSITSSDLVWTDSAGTVLAEGPAFSRSDLPVGTQVITLTATNSAGVSASTSVRVVVGDDLNEPGPTLAIAPAQVSWNSAPGATAVLTASLAINNAGGGTLNWTASSDGAWLSLDASEGSAPATLVLSADPGGFSENSINQATVTLRAVDSGGNTIHSISVPVSVYVGNPGYAEPVRPNNGRFIYLPMIAR
jgi:hypothetical protein